MSITLDWLINESQLKNLKLLTCPHLLQSPVTSVNIMDNPDILKWMKKGELVITTGYVFLDNPELQATILREIKASGCSALCFKTKRYFDSVPEHLILLAQEIELPIIELPSSYSFSEIAKIINTQLYMEEFQDVAREQNLFNSLFNLIFDRRPLSEALDLLSNYINYSIFIVDLEHNCCFSSILPNDTVFDAKKSKSYSHLVFQNEHPGQIDSGFVDTISIGNFQMTASIFPMQNGAYFLCVPGAKISSLPTDTIVHAIKIISFTPDDMEFKQSNLSTYYDSLFQFLINTESHSSEEAIQLYEYYGFPYRKERVCMLLSSFSSARELDYQSSIRQVKSLISEMDISYDSYFIAYSRNQICIYLFGKRGNLNKLVRSFSKELHELYRDTFLLSSSSCSSSLEHIPNSYKEASFMLSLKENFSKDFSFIYEDYLIFWQIQFLNEEQKKKILDDTITPLIEYDREHHSYLVQTLTEYCHCKFNASMTASNLFIHRNTFLKRMDKIRKVLGYDIEDSYTLFSLHYGTCIFRMQPQ